MVHLSTTYCNVDISDMYEKVYDLPNNTPDQVLGLVESSSDDQLAKLEKKYLTRIIITP